MENKVEVKFVPGPQVNVVEVRCVKCDALLDKVPDRRTAIMRSGDYSAHVCEVSHQ